MRTRTLLTQVLAVNSLLVGMTAIVAVGITRDQLGDADQRRGPAAARARRLQRGAPELAADPPPPGADGAPRADDGPGRPQRPRHARQPAALGRPRGPEAHHRLQPHAQPHRGRAPPGRPRRAARPGAGALAHRPGPPRRGQPGAHRHPAAPRGDHDGRPARAAARAAGDQAPRQPGDGGAPAARAPAAPDRARRPRPDPRARLPGGGLRAAHRHRRALLAPRRACPR